MDPQLENTVTNTLIPVLDVEPRGPSGLISSKRACCAVRSRQGERREGGGRNEEWRQITTIIPWRQQHTPGCGVHPNSREGV